LTFNQAFERTRGSVVDFSLTLSRACGITRAAQLKLYGAKPANCRQTGLLFRYSWARTLLAATAGLSGQFKAIDLESVSKSLETELT